MGTPLSKSKDEQWSLPSEPEPSIVAFAQPKDAVPDSFELELAHEMKAALEHAEELVQLLQSHPELHGGLDDPCAAVNDRFASGLPTPRHVRGGTPPRGGSATSPASILNR